jgi:hypothetical protein
MAHRWTIKELNADPASVLRRLCLERRQSCTNPNAPLYRRMDELADLLHVNVRAAEVNKALEQKES